MNEIIVPVDLTEEEKTILALLSLRQLFLIGPAVFLTLIQLFLFNLPFVHGIVDFLLRFLIFVVVNGVAAALAFIKIDKRNQYLSEYVVSKLKFMRSQKVYK